MNERTAKWEQHNNILGGWNDWEWDIFIHILFWLPTNIHSRRGRPIRGQINNANKRKIGEEMNNGIGFGLKDYFIIIWYNIFWWAIGHVDPIELMKAEGHNLHSFPFIYSFPKGTFLIDHFPRPLILFFLYSVIPSKIASSNLTHQTRIGLDLDFRGFAGILCLHFWMTF